MALAHIAQEHRALGVGATRSRRSRPEVSAGLWRGVGDPGCVSRRANAGSVSDAGRAPDDFALWSRRLAGALQRDVGGALCGRRNALIGRRARLEPDRFRLRQDGRRNPKPEAYSTVLSSPIPTPLARLSPAAPANLAPPFALSLSKREAWRLRWPVHSSTGSERTGFGLGACVFDGAERAALGRGAGVLCAPPGRRH